MNVILLDLKRGFLGDGLRTFLFLFVERGT